MLAISSRELRAPRRNGTPSWRGCHDDEVARRVIRFEAFER
jgi:hypothetical protein